MVKSDDPLRRFYSGLMGTGHDQRPIQ
jgi:hypothetical protein